MSSGEPFNIMTQDFAYDPYPLMHRMREEDPVHYFEPLKIWLLTRYDHTEAVLRDSRLINDRARELIMVMMPTATKADADEMIGLWSHMLWFTDQPEHTRLRHFMNRGFTPSSMDELRSSVAASARASLAAARDKGGDMDVAAELADPIAINTIMAMFGVPDEDRPQFKTWIGDIFKIAGAAAVGEDETAKVKSSSREMFGYLGELVEDHRKRPREGMISRFMSGDPAPSIQDVVVQCYQVMAAGYRTSLNQITNAALTLASHPSELSRLRADPGLLKDAIEEVLRHQPSAMATNRLCAEDMEIGGKAIKKGDFVFPLVAGANRDPAVFADPDRFDITRRGAKHLSFSLGPHYCIGAPLIRMEVEESLRAMLDFNRWELGSVPKELYSFSLVDRGPSRLPMRFGMD